MKTLLSFTMVALFLIVTTTNAQEQYTVDGKQYSLFTEIEGPLTLLWNTIDGEYRYFSKKGSDISELKNTKVDGKYREEFKEVLVVQTADAPVDFGKLNLTLPSLSKFFVAYNKATDPNFVYETNPIQLKTRLGVFGGISNNIYSERTSNDLKPSAGVDFEIIDKVKLRRHSILLRFKHVFSSTDFESSISQFSLNYRFKFIKTPKFDAFINTKFVAYTYSSERNKVDPDPMSSTGIFVIEAGGNLNAPAAFGLGADYAVGNGYITFCYNDIVALGVTSNGEFPTDFTLGYKFNL